MKLSFHSLPFPLPISNPSQPSSSTPHPSFPPPISPSISQSSQIPLSHTDPCPSSSLPQGDTLSLPRQHQMTTHSQNNIFKTKQFNNGTVRYPLPKALLANISSREEPSCFTQANKDAKS